MISNAYAMAQNPAGTQPPAGGILSSPLFMIVVVFAIFYFLIIRPQRKKDVEHKKFLSELKKGDEVLTQAGIYGRVAAIDDQIVTLEVANQVKIRVAKATIAGSTAPVQKAS